MKLFERLNEDVRFREGLKACMNCGVCTAICPAAEFFDYDPRVLMDVVDSGDNNEIESLLKSDAIWYCGQCMSCKTRCPRGNVPGMVVNALRKLSQELGYFTESRLGRQQYVIVKTVGQNILDFGYCVHPSRIHPDDHPEQGPVWKWVFENRDEVYGKLGFNLNSEGPGGLRKISDKTLNELKSIFDVTGATKFLESIETHCLDYAVQNGQLPAAGNKEDYFRKIYEGEGGLE